MNGTSSGQARAEILILGSSSRSAFSYALLLIVARVPITPICRLRVAAIAACAPGLITPTTGTDNVFSSFGKATAEAELHAITMVFTPSSTSMSVISRL